MPKLKTSIKGVFSVPEPVVDDPRTLVANNADLVSTAAEDGLVAPIPDSSINDFVDVSQVLITAASVNDVTGDPDGVGATTLEYTRNWITLNGACRMSKPHFIRSKTMALAPFGAVFNANIAAAYADAQFTSAIGYATTNLAGSGSLKFSAFLAFEARLRLAVHNALNRDITYTAATQSARLAPLFSYERDLLWLQELINGVGRVLGWYKFANPLCLIDPALSSTGTLASPEFYDQMKLLAKIVAQFKTVDPDTHTTIQFLNDFKVHERKFIRLPSVHRESVLIHNPFFTGTYDTTCNMAPIPTRVTTAEAKLIAATNTHSSGVYDLPTQDYVDNLLFVMSTADTLAALKEIVTLANGMLENYTQVLKFLNTLEAKKIVTLTAMSTFLYFDGKELQQVEPYFSYTERAIDRGWPFADNSEAAAPTYVVPCMLSAGAPDTAGRYMIQGSLASNVAHINLCVTDKQDNSLEYFWQCYKSFITAPAIATVDMRATTRWINCFNGMLISLDQSYLLLTHNTNVNVDYLPLSMDADFNVAIAARNTAALKNYLPFVYEGAWPTNVVAIDILGAIFGTPTATDKCEMHDQLMSQYLWQARNMGSQYAYVGVVNTAGEVGYVGVVGTDLNVDSYLIPVSVDFMRRHASDYYAKMYPAIETARMSGSSS